MASRFAPSDLRGTAHEPASAKALANPPFCLPPRPREPPPRLFRLSTRLDIASTLGFSGPLSPASPTIAARNHRRPHDSLVQQMSADSAYYLSVVTADLRKGGPACGFLTKVRPLTSAARLPGSLFTSSSEDKLPDVTSCG